MTSKSQFDVIPMQLNRSLNSTHDHFEVLLIKTVALYYGYFSLANSLVVPMRETTQQPRIVVLNL